MDHRPAGPCDDCVVELCSGHADMNHLCPNCKWKRCTTCAVTCVCGHEPYKSVRALRQHINRKRKLLSTAKGVFIHEIALRNFAYLT